LCQTSLVKPAVLFVLAACGAAQHPAPREGTVVGLARDHDSGDPVAHAELRLRVQGDVRGRAATSGKQGAFAFEHLPPGRYSLSASFAGQPVNVDNITVAAGKTAVVDVTFTLGQPDPVMVDFGNAKEGAIDRYHPAHHAQATGIIEGTVSDAGTHERVAGAVITAARGTNALQGVTDDQGRFRFDDVEPGTYVVSAYYSIAGHGQIEQRRSDIAVAGGEGVIVPLFIELTRQ
jgi:uncharacterized surface anchored protein